MKGITFAHKDIQLVSKSTEKKTFEDSILRKKFVLYMGHNFFKQSTGDPYSIVSSFHSY